MASIQKMEERTARAMSVHEKTAQRLAALKAQYERESRKLQEHKDKLNLAWVRGFARQAEKEGIQMGRQGNDESKESPASAETEERKEREVSL